MTVTTQSVESLISEYIATRDSKAELKAKQAEELKPLDDKLYAIECRLKSVLDQTGVESMKTSAGTAYLTTRTSVSVADKQAFMDYIRAHEAFELLDIKANKTACEDFLQEHNDVPPGTNVVREERVGFRRA